MASFNRTKALLERASETEFVLDLNKPWEENAKTLRTIAGDAWRLRVVLANGIFDEPASLAKTLQQCYSLLQEGHYTDESPKALPEMLEVVPLLAGEGACRLAKGYSPVACLGGTFDHLHAGHKVLLAVAAAIATEKMLIGVSGDPLLTNKTNAEVLEPWHNRAKVVSEFVAAMRPDLPLTLDWLPDAFGPSLWPTSTALVVSEETAGGGQAVNDKRLELNLRPLDIVVTPLVLEGHAASADSPSKTGEKESSSSIRKKHAGLQALRRCWFAVADALKLDEERSEMWARLLAGVASASVLEARLSGRVPPLEMQRERLEASMQDLQEPIAAGKSLAFCLAAAVGASEADSEVHRSTELQEVLLQLLDREFNGTRTAALEAAQRTLQSLRRAPQSKV
mmetsp:Transcript_26947/g.58652  ORF Transcript_26947/g.58652 Transcript_26947/m.58652 type:complete len:396 (+) Transcript_26947:378-1565(+)|eukprot:CAMPEP_0206432158 /NCGR_PEP_ID=MMETSP0324_2-20121206/7759_1 /ASSEMBLY_ACC=CAM_ASM_000836 /TAXON_ID=2866 /ORGANISM="Crypthecodinium cohnii, Strain Seligo" /LENGTH=395 /DNA_ID=CAMNT_0053898155 /DNA_START=303 /DNA_END=1490 /DNA_ORIENTATION=-